MSYGYDTDTFPYDPEEIQMEARDMEEIYHLTTGDRSISVGVHEVNRYDFEVWLDRADEKTKYFGSFDDLDEFIREQYPDADWEL
jgi:hypothetical protein